MPDGALTALPDGATANATLLAGEPVHRRRIGRAGDGPVAAMLPDGTRGVAVPRDESSLPLRPGDRVDVVAAFTVGAGGAARLVAAGVTVAHVGDRSVVVAVAGGAAGRCRPGPGRRRRGPGPQRQPVK